MPPYRSKNSEKQDETSYVEEEEKEPKPENISNGGRVSKKRESDAVGEREAVTDTEVSKSTYMRRSKGTRSVVSSGGSTNQGTNKSVMPDYETDWSKSRDLPERAYTDIYVEKEPKNPSITQYGKSQARGRDSANRNLGTSVQDDTSEEKKRSLEGPQKSRRAINSLDSSVNKNGNRSIRHSTPKEKKRNRTSDLSQTKGSTTLDYDIKNPKVQSRKRHRSRSTGSPRSSSQSRHSRHRHRRNHRHKSRVGTHESMKDGYHDSYSHDHRRQRLLENPEPYLNTAYMQNANYGMDYCNTEKTSSNVNGSTSQIPDDENGITYEKPVLMGPEYTSEVPRENLLCKVQPCPLAHYFETHSRTFTKGDVYPAGLRHHSKSLGIELENSHSRDPKVAKFHFHWPHPSRIVCALPSYTLVSGHWGANEIPGQLRYYR